MGGGSFVEPAAPAGLDETARAFTWLKQERRVILHDNLYRERPRQEGIGSVSVLMELDRVGRVSTRIE
jgi:hypothetical protein